MLYDLPVCVYESAAGGWHFAGISAADQPAEQLSVATWNVWFGESHWAERAYALLEILRQKRPDIIALQEVTPDFLEVLLQQIWVQDDYFVSDSAAYTVLGYGVVLLSRLPLAGLRLLPLPSTMGRRLLTATLQLNGQSLGVGTVHLESLMEEGLRMRQLEHIFAALAPFDQALLLGDMNFAAGWPEEACVPAFFGDVWPRLHPDDPGFTKDSTINLMRASSSGSADLVRFDRLFLRDSVPGWQPVHIERLGLNPVSPTQPRLFPSDHFGLYCRLEWG